MIFRVFISGAIYGPFPVAELFSLKGFELTTPVCPDGDDSWEAAGQYPTITNYLPQQASGDYLPAPITPEPSGTIPQNSDENNNESNHDWRKAVIGKDLPSLKLYSAPAPPSPIAKLERGIKISGSQPRRALLLLLGLVSVAAYYPQSQNLAPFLAELQSDKTVYSAMGYRFQMGGAPSNRGSGKDKAIQNGRRMSEKPAGRHSRGIVEIGSEDLGNGLILKTVVLTEIKDGVETQRTTTLTVSTHPRKPKDGRN